MGLGTAVVAQTAPEPVDTPAPALQPLPTLSPPPRTGRADAGPTFLRARELRSRIGQDAVAEGEVELRRGGIVMRADTLSLSQPDDLARAQGHVRISHDGNVYEGTYLQLQIERFEGFFLEPTYFFSRVGAGGHAQRLEFLDTQRSRAVAATYSSCPADSSGGPAWELQARSVRIDLETNEGVAEGAVLRFYDVPILAAPTLSFPLTDARKSGWLPPTFNIDSRSGVELSVPYYWNIAPQYDATVAPVLYSRRGAGADGEFRYLEPGFSGSVGLRWLPHDRLVDRSRWSLDAVHASTPQRQWDYSLAVKRVSDDGYWKDFPRGIDHPMPRLLPADLRGQGRFRPGLGDLTAYARVLRWQVLQDVDPLTRVLAPYERAPQIGARWLAQAPGGLELALEGEFNRFGLPPGEDDPARNTGDRLHALGSLARPWSGAGWSLVPRVALNAATYDTDRALANGRTRTSRAIPTFSLDGALELERQTTWLGRAVRQTLEPRLLYVRTPFRDQSLVPNFDAAGKDFNFDTIYTANSFSGVDRVSDADALTAGVTTRVIDDATGAEALRLGLVQRYLFRDQRITPEGPANTRRLSDLLLLGSTSLVPNWSLDSSLQYDPDLSHTVRSVLGVRYAPGPFRTLSATYRFARSASEQFEAAWQWPLGGRTPQAPDARISPLVRAMNGGTGQSCTGAWYSVGRINYSLRDSRVTDSVVGFEYDAGCWIGRVVAERLSTGRSQATTRMLFQLELVGLSRLGSNPLQVLKDNIPGYRLLREERTAPDPGSLYD